MLLWIAIAGYAVGVLGAGVALGARLRIVSLEQELAQYQLRIVSLERELIHYRLLLEGGPTEQPPPSFQ